MADTNLTRRVPVAAMLLLAGAAAAATSANPDFGFGARVHVMPLIDDQGARNIGAPHLNYYGGHVISNVNVVVVFWGPNVDSTVRSQIGGFYSAVTDSPYMDWLTEYNTNITAVDGGPGTNQFIGRGSLAGTVTITPSHTSTFLQDTDIQSEINSQINAGALPAPDANTLYMVYFPPGILIALDGEYSCQQFCAYHGTFSRAGSPVPYGVMPDFGPGSGCDIGCGSNPTMFNNITSVSSHELVESITDMEVGLATVIGRPLAWYDPTNGEIGDICNGLQSSIAGYVVQRQWSNQANDCITSRGVGGGGVVNGGFETGDFTGWTVTGLASVVPVPHSGNYSALVGSIYPSGHSAISQTFNMPATANTISVYYAVWCPDTVDYDWAEATIRDNVTLNTITILPRTCNTSYIWTEARASVASMRGHSVTITLVNHDDGYWADPTYTLYDDVTVQ